MELKNFVKSSVEKFAELGSEIKRRFKYCYAFYGIPLTVLFLVTLIAVPVKILVFYLTMGISSYLILVWLVSCLLIYLLFASFRNKWIPAVFFLLISFLMFADAAYSSFFNRYLSVNMLGAAGLLGGVKESVKEVVKLKFFAFFIDVLLIFTSLAAGKIMRHKANALQKGEEVSLGPIEERDLSKDTKNRANVIIDKSKHPILGLILLGLIISGLGGSSIVASINNQEFFSYHIRDIASKALNLKQGMYVDENDIWISTGSYEKEINGPLFGIAKGRNLIVIQVESLQNLAVNVKYNGEEITPNLNALIKEQSIYFNNYYEQRGSGNTSDAEYATNNSLYGSINSYTYGLFSNNYFRGLPWQLKEIGYSTAAFHGYKKDFWSRDLAYPGQGFDQFYSQDNFDPTLITGMGVDDTVFFTQSISYMKTMQQPFYSFLVTLSNHYPYQMPNKYLKIPLKDEDKGTIFGAYINSVNHTDFAIGQFIQELKDAGFYENSIIAIYGDHFGLTPNDPEIYASLSRFLGKKYDYDTMMNVPLIINIPGVDVNKTISISGGQLDFMPTISYLLGLEKLDTLYFGQNLLTAKSGFVAEQAYMPKGSFIADDIIFQMSKDGVFENSRAWNFKTGEKIPLEDCKSGFIRSNLITDTSEMYLSKDILRQVFLEDKDD